MSDTATPTAATPTPTPEELAALAPKYADALRGAKTRSAAPMGFADYLNITQAADFIEAQRAEIERLTADNEQLNATFDLRHKADARAIKQWQEVTGKTMSMPDQADLCVFLMMALDMSEARATTAEAALAASLERERGMREALNLAANRLSRCAIDHPAGSREMSERSEWADEARCAALAAKEITDGR